MPAYGVEILRHKAELKETKDRIHELLERFNFEDEKPQQQEEKTRLKSISKVASRFERQVSPEDSLEVRQKLYELFDSLHLEERYNMLSQVCDWFVGHTPAAQKDIAILDKADKECLQRECERAWTALATDDTIRKKERNTIRQVHEFVQAVGVRHHEHKADAGDSDDESIVRFDPRLTSLTDAQMEKELEALRQRVLKKERDVVLILLNIAERGSFLTGSRIEHIKNHFETDSSIDLIAEQEEIWLVAEEELRRLEEQKDLIYETIGYVRSHAKQSDVRPPSEHLLEYLHKKRFEVQAVHGPGLLEKRMQDYGKDLEPPDTEHLTQLREESAELNSRIQRAAACKIRISSEAAVAQDFDRKVVQLSSGLTPQVELLEQLEVVMDPAKDFGQEAIGDDDNHRKHAADVEKLSRKKGELLSTVSRMQDEQLALQREWMENHAALQASEAASAQQEQLLKTAQESLRILQEQHALATTTMGCLRSNSATASPFAAIQGSRRPSNAASRPPSGSLSLRWVPRRSVLEDAEFEDASSASRQTSGSKDSLPAEPQGGRRRSLFVDPADPNSAWSIESVVSEAVGEVLGTRPATGSWVTVFDEDAGGRFRRSAFAAQKALLSQLEKEESSLKAEVEELEAAMKEHVQKALSLMPKRDEYTQQKSHELKVCSKNVQEVVENMQRQRDALLNLSWQSGSGRMTQAEFNSRVREVEACRTSQAAGEAPKNAVLEEVMDLSAQNRDLMRRMTALGKETAPMQAAHRAERVERTPRRRLNALQSLQVQEKWKNRHLRQQCRELNLLRERVRLMKEEKSESSEGLKGLQPVSSVQMDDF